MIRAQLRVPSRGKGFTLIEMLVAVFLLAVLGAAGFTMLFQMNDTRNAEL